MTRKWRDHKSLVQLVRLFLIDEVHQLNDEVRGPTVEAIVSRMKTIRAAAGEGGDVEGGRRGGGLRFIAVSATIPNITDVSSVMYLMESLFIVPSSSQLCSWLGSEDTPALEYKYEISDNSHLPLPVEGASVHLKSRDVYTNQSNRLLPFRIDESHRPVRLRKVVLGYPSSSSDFKFNLSLNYRISGVIHTYSDQKPCLVVGVETM